MITEKTKQQTDFIKMVANCLAKNFIRSLFELTKEKSHSAQIGASPKYLIGQKSFVTNTMIRFSTRTYQNGIIKLFRV